MTSRVLHDVEEQAPVRRAGQADEQRQNARQDALEPHPAESAANLRAPGLSALEVKEHRLDEPLEPPAHASAGKQPIA